MAKFRKGQKVVCIHYKDKPVVTVDSVDTRANELWVNDSNPKVRGADYWYGPLNWFKPLRKGK